MIFDGTASDGVVEAGIKVDAIQSIIISRIASDGVVGADTNDDAMITIIISRIASDDVVVGVGRNSDAIPRIIITGIASDDVVGRSGLKVDAKRSTRYNIITNRTSAAGIKINPRIISTIDKDMVYLRISSTG